jgi:hypothetical protein
MNLCAPTQWWFDQVCTSAGNTLSEGTYQRRKTISEGKPAAQESITSQDPNDHNNRL